ncbi:MAG: hypothetical protein IPN42_10880 [Methylococcaceae bacterium]|nr:hypothetical protein [Methylococcaceae bacterium]
MAFKKLKFGLFFTFSFGLFILLNFMTVANAETDEKDRFALPSSMVNIPVCQKKALLLHPGTIKGLRTLHQNGVFLFQIRITQKNDVDVLVFCDGETGNISEKMN